MARKQKQPVKDVSASVMKKLKDGNVKMHSRRHFALLSAFTAAALIASTISIIYLVNISTLRLRDRAAFDYLGFGRHGFSEFLGLLPWGWIILTIVLLTAVVILLKRYDFVRKHHFYGIVAGIAAALLLAGGISAYSGLNPPGSPRPPRRLAGLRPEERGRLRGVIISFDGDKATLKQSTGEEIELDLSDNKLQIGSVRKDREVVVLGEWKDEVFRVKAIRPVLKKPLMK